MEDDRCLVESLDQGDTIEEIAFNAEAHVAAGEAAVSWQYKEGIAQGMRAGHEVLPGEAGPTESELPPGALREEREHGGKAPRPR